MNMLAQIQNDNNTDQVTMVSLELVDYINDSRKFDEKPVQLRHADFMAKVPKVLGIETSEKFRSSYLAGNGEQRPCYRFPKREACLMAMSYSYELQAQVFDRMTAMEDALKANKPVKLSRMDLIQLALQAEQENQALRGQVAVLEPKANALDIIADTSNTYTIRECVKAIGSIREKELIQLLIDKKWIYRDAAKKLQPCAQFVTNGVFLNRTSPVITNAYDGQERVFLHMRVTAFGLTRITGLVNKMRNAKQVAA